MIRGYKCFNEALTNRHGTKFEVGKTYVIESNSIKFGVDGCGYHMCKNIEDTLRYYDAMNKNVSICEVIGYGKFNASEDEYYGYYDMFSVEKISIIRLLSREEIIGLAVHLDEDRLKRFIKGYRLNEDEIEIFEKKYANSQAIINAIEYYQKGNTEAYSMYEKQLIKPRRIRNI